MKVLISGIFKHALSTTSLVVWYIFLDRPFAVLPIMPIEVVYLRMATHVVPKASPVPLPELATYLTPLAPLCRRSTSRASVERSLTGVLTDLPRKNCDTIAAAVVGTSTARLPHRLPDATWESQTLDPHRVQPLVAQSPPKGSWSWTTPGCPSQGGVRWASPASIRAPWARSPRARSSLRPTTWRMSRRAGPPSIGP
jgi:hypothetical protein